MLKKYSTIAKAFVLLFMWAFSFLPGDAVSSDMGDTNAKVDKILHDYRGNPVDLTEAHVLIQSQLKKNPRDAMAYVNYSRYLCKEGYIKYQTYKPGTLEKAREALGKALEIDPELYDAYYHGVYLYVFSMNLDKAKQFTMKAHELDPGSPRTDLLFATIALEENRLGDVIQKSQAAIGKSDDKYILRDAWFYQSKAYLRQGAYEKVDDIYQKMIRLFPEDPRVMDSYANFLAQRGRSETSMESGEEALEAMNSGVARTHLAEAYYKKAARALWEEKQYEAASKDFLLSIKYHPTSNAYYGLGISYWQLGHLKRQVNLMKNAEVALKKAVELDGENEEAATQLKNLQLQLRSYGG